MHINPDGKDLTGTKVDLATLPWGHVYSQPYEHAEARIVGNRKALLLIRDAIDAVLDQSASASVVETTTKEDIFATDGEGYQVVVTALPDSPERVWFVANPWDRHQPHYCFNHEIADFADHLKGKLAFLVGGNANDEKDRQKAQGVIDLFKGLFEPEEP